MSVAGISTKQNCKT